MFGPVRIRSDAFGCSRMHLSVFGYVRKLPEIFGVFETIVLVLGRLWPRELTFIDILRLGSLLLWGLTTQSQDYKKSRIQ